MNRRFLFFLPLSLLLLGGLQAGVRLASASRFDTLQPIEQPVSRVDSRFTEGGRAVFLRQQVIESLERLLVEQHRFRAVHGRFTRNLRRLDWEVSREVREEFEFTVVDATQDRLLVTATSEVMGSLQFDTLSIDQNARLHASFPIPPPRVEYLRERVLKELASARGPEAAIVSMSARTGPWAGFFEFRGEVEGERLAVGIKEPVLGVRVVLEGEVLEGGGRSPEWSFRNSLQKQTQLHGEEGGREVRRMPTSTDKASIPSEEPLIVEPLR